MTTYETQAIETIQEAAANHGEGLYALTSFGVESALLFDLVNKAGVKVDFLSIDTGFWFPETYDFKDELTDRYQRLTCLYGPDANDVAAITDSRLWETDIDQYHEITKHEPLRRAIRELGVTALLSGVRAGQTPNRAELRTVEPGRDGEVRLHPLLNWTEERAGQYFEDQGLPRHPLYAFGYGSVGDWTTTRPGMGRGGRDLPHSECGLHVAADGRLVRANA